MANYESALKTTLVDYLEHRASAEGVSVEELRQGIDVVPIDVSAVSLFNEPKRVAVRRFNDEAIGVTDIVELEESHVGTGLLGHIASYSRISGIGIR
ncbi:hypothetical protein GOV06_02150 [Candidatus Woesearchaeota archaeon]|nr:hypothetical protein [Candidatus Woesearchaeota archaeon]